MNTFGKRLQALRQDKDETQKDLAKILNVSPRMISYFEADTHFPRDARIIQNIAAHFNVSADYLFCLSDNIGISGIAKLYNILPPVKCTPCQGQFRFLGV